MYVRHNPNQGALVIFITKSKHHSYNIITQFIFLCLFFGGGGCFLLGRCFRCPHTAGGKVVDANTLALGGILTDLHMSGCLLWWLGILVVIGVFYHIPEQLSGSLNHVYTLSEQCVPITPFFCDTHILGYQGTKHKDCKYETYIKCVQ